METTFLLNVIHRPFQYNPTVQCNAYKTFVYLFSVTRPYVLIVFCLSHLSVISNPLFYLRQPTFLFSLTHLSVYIQPLWKVHFCSVQHTYLISTTQLYGQNNTILMYTSTICLTTLTPLPVHSKPSVIWVEPTHLISATPFCYFFHHIQPSVPSVHCSTVEWTYHHWKPPFCPVK